MECLRERSYDILSPIPEEHEARDQDEDVHTVYVERGLHIAKSRVNEHGGVNPTWNEVVKVKSHEGLPENVVMAASNVEIYAHVREKSVRSAKVLLSNVMKGRDAADNQIQCLTVQVWRPSGMPMGCLACGFHICILLLNMYSSGEREKGCGKICCSDPTRPGCHDAI